ncbi:MAG: cupin domain-containing protein [Bacteroidota bacterium]
MKIASIYKDLEYNPKRPSVSILFETDFTKELRIAMQKGTVMKEHRTKYPIVVAVLEGDIDFGVQGQTHKLLSGDLITLHGDVPHDLKANANSIVRLTLAKFDDTERVREIVAN